LRELDRRTSKQGRFSSCRPVESTNHNTYSGAHRLQQKQTENHNTSSVDVLENNNYMFSYIRTEIGREADNRVGSKKHRILCRLTEVKKAPVVAQTGTRRVAIQGEDTKPTIYMHKQIR
jgi:hypothetical protein